MIRRMPPTRTIQIVMSDEFRAALQSYCDTHGEERSTFVRRIIAETIGRPDLIQTIRPEGRPPLPSGPAAEPPPLAPSKPARKRKR